jgi:hypothetical protein
MYGREAWRVQGSAVGASLASAEVVATAHPVTFREVRSGKLLPDQCDHPRIYGTENPTPARRAPARAWGAITDPSLRQTMDGTERTHLNSADDWKSQASAVTPLRHTHMA